MEYTSQELRTFMLKEIEIIQEIIKRMAFNSFMIKGWTVTLVAITLLLKGSPHQAFIAFIPLLVFWYLDAYFLHQERLYRRLYRWVVENRLKTSEYLFDLNAYRFAGEEQSRFRIMFSLTLFSFYGSIFLLIFLYLVLLFGGLG